MTNEEIFAKLKEVLAMVKPKMDMSKVSMDSSLVLDLGIDSLSMLLMSLAIEQKLNFQFNATKPFETVREVVEHIASEINK
ncbi:MAG: hypothetical protein HUJ92_06480 [Bacteroidales bacterium]|nr:hypothetical protein [Bacteroidales bacterium]